MGVLCFSGKDCELCAALARIEGSVQVSYIYRDQELSCANVPGHFYDLPRVCLIPCASLLSCCYSDAQKMKMLKKTENSSICAVI